MKFLFMFAYWLILACSLCGQNYFISHIDGNNSNDGKGYTTAWRDLKAVQDYAASPGFSDGDKLYFHVDGKWFPGQELTNSDGTKGCNFVIPQGIIAISDYKTNGYSGTGALPQIMGTVSLNGNWTFAWDGVKSEGYVDNSSIGSWKQYTGDSTGETYYKICRVTPRQMWDNFTMMTPVVTPANATVVTINRGEFTYIKQNFHSNLSAFNDCLFFRSSSGAKPSTRNIQATAMNLKGKNGLIEANDMNQCYISDIKVTGALWDGGYPAGIAVTGNSAVVEIIRCQLWRNALGVQFLDRPYYNCKVTNSTFDDNYSRGLGIQGVIDKIEIKDCTFDRNGRRPIYCYDGFNSSADDDAIGIGQQGCTANKITIDSCNIYHSGEIADSDDVAGSGIYLGTDQVCDVKFITIKGCKIYKSHGWGIHISLDDCQGGLIKGNTLKYNVNAHKNRYHAPSKWIAPVKTGKCDFINNTVTNNYSQFAGVDINQPVTATGNVISNNKSAYPDPSFTWWGEVVLENWTSAGTFDYNTLINTNGNVLMKHCGLGSYSDRPAYFNDSGNSKHDSWQ